jgi:Zn-dependent metalloprotease
MELGGYAWERAGKIWYIALCDALRAKNSFATAAKRTWQVAGVLFGEGSEEQKAVKTGWTGVGVKIPK